MPPPKPLVLIILDGWGINPKKESNAIVLADPPFYRHLLETYPHTTLSASGEDVGLPSGQMGNSEVGHMNIGAGRIVYQDLTRINKSLSDGSYYAHTTLLTGLSPAEGRSLHLMGLLSDGGVHSHMDHLIALLEMARRQRVSSLIVHPFLDGRDTPPQSAPSYIETLEQRLKSAAPPGASWRIGTLMGRYYAMDRDLRWDRIKKAYDAVVRGDGNKAISAVAALEKSYAEGKTDEFVYPTVICKNDTPVGLLGDNDSVIFYNFRADRARQLTRALALSPFTAFERERAPHLASFVTMTAYDESFSFPVAFPPLRLDSGLGDVLSKRGLKQLRLAETEKYAHVTYFFNGGREIPFEGETRTLIPSPKHVATYDQLPQMSAYEVAEEARRQIATGVFDFILINFANPDMVGHSGNLKAAMEAVQAVDRCLEKVVSATLEVDGAVLITADHGNLEQMIDYETGEPHTAHTTLPVPFILAAQEERLHAVRLRPGIHANISPTILQLLEIPKPEEQDQASLIIGDRLIPRT